MQVGGEAATANAPDILNIVAAKTAALAAPAEFELQRADVERLINSLETADASAALDALLAAIPFALARPGRRSVWPRRASVGKPQARSGSCSGGSGAPEQPRSSRAARAAGLLSDGRRCPIRTISGSLDGRTCPPTRVLRRADSSVFAVQTVRSASGLSAQRSRACSMRAGCSTIHPHRLDSEVQLGSFLARLRPGHGRGRNQRRAVNVHPSQAPANWHFHTCKSW
jgi:hypothetical protein